MEHLSSLSVAGGKPYEIACMPFEITRFSNGVEDCRIQADESAPALALPEWAEQIITTQPVPLSIWKVVRQVADRGGGAHVHDAQDKLLERLQGISPSGGSAAASMIIGIGRVLLQLGNSVIRRYELRDGEVPLPVVDAPEVPASYYDEPYEKLNLLEIVPT